jgi:isopenicillin-N N-acyltransferase like protein
MHDTATEFVILLRLEPTNGAHALVFTTVGCLGQIGLNSAGIAVGINNLLGADGQIGVTWPFVVRKILQQENIDAALACITETPLAGAHNYLLFDSVGRGYNVEAMSTHQEITPLGDDCLVHTNHCLLPETNALAQVRPPVSQASSEARLNRAMELLQKRPITHHDLIALTRDAEAICVRAAPPLHIESCGAAIMRPRSGDFWAVWGLPSENEYEHFRIGHR